MSMFLNHWTMFANDCGITDNKTVGVRVADLDSMFIATNYEEETMTEEADANAENALVRCEMRCWLDIMA